jgi:hypothetical protein
MARARVQGKHLGRPHVETYKYCLDCGPPFSPGHFRHNGLARRGHRRGIAVRERFEGGVHAYHAGRITLDELAAWMVLSPRSVKRLLERIGT